MALDQAMTTFTNITISWTAPSNDDGVAVLHCIQSITNGIPTTDNYTTEVMHTFNDFNPSTRMDFSVNAISICGLMGEPSIATKFTDAIHK